jgi:hypothetical protein
MTETDASGHFARGITASSWGTEPQLASSRNSMTETDGSGYLVAAPMVAPLKGHAAQAASTWWPSEADRAGQAASSAQDQQPPDDDDDEIKTTLMVRDLPADLSQTAFVQDFRDIGYAGLFDFVYMPMNFRNPGSSFGYAFINFTSHGHALSIMNLFASGELQGSCQGWSAMWSSNQGSCANVERYRNSPLMHNLVPAECKPAMFGNTGQQVAFPPSTRSIPKPRVHRPTAVKDGNADDTEPSPAGQSPPASLSTPTALVPDRSGDCNSPKQRPGRSKRRGHGPTRNR